MATKLTAKQERFCLEFIGNAQFNATEAARNAKYSEKTAYSIGHENLKKPEIKARIAELIKERCVKLGVDPDWVVIELVQTYLAAKSKGDYRAAVQALAQIGKNTGGFTDHVDHTSKGDKIENAVTTYQLPNNGR